MKDTHSEDPQVLAAVKKKLVATATWHPVYVLALIRLGTAVAQWLRCCATNQKVTGSIPDGVIGFFH